LKHLFQIVLIS